LQKSKQVTYFQNPMAQNKIAIPKGRNRRIAKKDGTKARKQFSRAE
jgi:hypothetical protein